MTQQATLFLDRLRLAIQWSQDISHNEMIQARGYSKDHLQFEGTISQWDLGGIVSILNTILEYVGSNLRVTDSMGEIIPVRVE